MTSNPAITNKILILGNSGVGKTCLYHRFSGDEFPTNARLTVTCEFTARCLTIANRRINFQFCDTAGEERYHNLLLKRYYRKADVVILVYDVTDRDSFWALPTWMQKCADNIDEFDDVLKVIIGNKCDLSGRTVSLEEGQKYALMCGAEFYELSAKTDDESSWTPLLTKIGKQILFSKSQNLSEDEFIQPSSEKVINNHYNICHVSLPDLSGILKPVVDFFTIKK